jgi:tetratricopeptide (TPR) repeat protein
VWINLLLYPEMRYNYGMENIATIKPETQKSKISIKFAVGVVCALVVIALAGYFLYEKKYKEEFTAADSAQLQSFMLKGDFVGAESLAMWYEAKFPNNIEIKLTKGVAQFQIHKFKEAAKSFQSVLALDPKNKEANNYMAIMFSPAPAKANTQAPATTKTPTKK